MVWWAGVEFRQVVDSDLGLALNMLDRSVHALQGLNRIGKVRTFTSAANRLAGVLLQYEALCFAPSAPLVPRRQLSALASMTTEMTNRILREWEARAIVRRVGASGLELIDRRALAAEAEPLADFPLPGPH